MGLGDDISRAFHTVTQDAGQAIDSVTSAVSELGNLGIPCPEYIVRLFLDEGWDAIQEVTTIYREVTAAGHDCVAFFDIFVSGCQQYGSPHAFLAHLAKQRVAQMLPDIEQMVNVWRRSAQPPLDMLAEIDTLLAQHPEFGASQGAQGAMALTFASRYQEIRANISQMAGPLASSQSSPWQGKDYGQDLNSIWSEFERDCASRLTSEWQGGSMGWRLLVVSLCVAAIVFDDVIVATAAVALAGPSFGASVPAGAAEITIWDLLMVCIAFEALNLLEPFIKMLLELTALLVDAAIVAPITYAWHEIQLGLVFATSLTEEAIKELARDLGVSEEIIRVWQKMGLNPEQMVEAAILLGEGLSVYDAGNLAKNLTPQQLTELLGAIHSYLALLCGGIQGFSDILVQLVQQGVNLFNIDAAKSANLMLRKLADLAQLAKSADKAAALGAQRVLGVLNKIGLQNVQNIDDPLLSGGQGADITLKGSPPVGIEVGGPSKTGNDAQYQDYIDEYGKGNVRAYIENNGGDGNQAITEAQRKLGRENVEEFTKDDLKCAS